MLRDGAEENVQLCVYVDEKCVVDLYGTAIGDQNYNADTVQTIYSSGKSIESIAMAMLYGKGEKVYNIHTPGWRQNLDESQCTGTIDSANNAILSPDFKNIIFKMTHCA